MSLLLAFMLQSAPFPVATAGPSEPTPESATVWTQKFDCDLVDANKKFYKLVVERLGGRGYWVESGSPKYKNFVQKTTYFIQTVVDETGTLEAFSAARNANRGHISEFYFRKNLNGLALVGSSHPSDQPQRGLAYIVLETIPSFTGHCVVTSKPQTSLSDKETEFYKNNLPGWTHSHELDELKKLSQSDKNQ